MEHDMCVVRLDPCHVMTTKKARTLVMLCTGITVGCGLAILGLGVASTTFLETDFTAMAQVDIEHVRSSTTGIGIAMLFLAIWGFFATMAGRVIFLYLYVLFLLLFSAVEVIMTAIVGHALTRYRKISQQNSADCMDGDCIHIHSVSAILAPTAIIFIVCACIHVLAAWGAYLLNFEFKLRKREIVVRNARNRQPAQNTLRRRDHNNNYVQENPEIILHREAVSQENIRDDRQGHIEDSSDFNQVMVSGKRSSFQSYPHHHSIGDITNLQTRRKKNALNTGDMYSSQHRARSCENLTSPRPEITVSFVEDNGQQNGYNQGNGNTKDRFIKVNVEPYVAIHLPVKRPSQGSSYEESHSRDLCHMEMGYFKGEPFKSYDDSVFISGPELDDDYCTDSDFTMPRDTAHFSAAHPKYKVEEDASFRYERRTSTDVPQPKQFSTQDLNLSIQGKVYKRKTPREVKRQNLTSKQQGGRSTGYGNTKRQLDAEVFAENQESIETYAPNVGLAHIKDANTGKLKPSYLSLPGLHLGEKLYGLRLKNPKSRSLEMLCDTDSGKHDFTKRPHSVTESSFPVSLNRNDSSHALMKSVFSGTYWKENGIDNSISSVDLQNSLMMNRSAIPKPMPQIVSPEEVKSLDAPLFTRSCVDINNAAESSFGRSILRKSVIDPSVAQSFQRSMQPPSHLPSPQDVTPNVYKTPTANFTRKQKFSRSNSGDDSSFVSFHSARQGDTSQKQASDDSDTTQTTGSSIPYYNYDQELDHCLNQMMMLASELQKKEFGQPHQEEGIDVSPLVKTGKSRSCSALMHLPTHGKTYGMSPSGSCSGRPYSRESAGSRGSASSQCSVGFRAAQIHNNSQFSAESMII